MIKYLVILLFVLFSCKQSQNLVSVLNIDNNKDGKNDQYMLSLNDSNTSIFIGTDEDRDGVIEDHLWVNAKSKDIGGKGVDLLFNEIKGEKGIFSRLWYGPSNIKLIEKTDEDRDGFIETTAYFNKTALPKVITGHVARIEIDSNKDGKVEVWIFPSVRFEVDKNGDGIPDEYSTNHDDLGKLEYFLSMDKLKELKTSPLNPSQSYTLHPEIIQDERLKAIIPFTLK
ncbi:MAG: hypothetical protein KDK90_21475 [Leptospiraceae bacterium]|nr:hypothetical protein [Leptospiraceae bacterium]